MDVIFRLRRRPSQRGSPPPTTAGLSLLLAASTSTTFLYDFLLRLASTVCLHPVIAIIIIVHFLFKRNIYLSLLHVIYVSFLF
jgi:hypothetical protein